MDGLDNHIDIEQMDEVESSGDDMQESPLIYHLNFNLEDNTGNIIENGEGQAVLEGEGLSIKSDYSDSLIVSYIDILEIVDGDYKVVLALNGRERMIFSNIGYKYEDFVKNLSRLRNDLLVKNLLMKEPLIKPGVDAEYDYIDEEGLEIEKGECEISLYETALILLKKRGIPQRIPYSAIFETVIGDYVIELSLESGEKIVISKLGRQFDSFRKHLIESINKLSIKAQLVIRELMPAIDQGAVRRVSGHMKDGKAVSRKDIENIYPKLWNDLENMLELSDIKEEYAFLKSISHEEKICIGLKRGLMGSLTGDYIWFLVPIYGLGLSNAGNAVAMEAASGEGGSRATFFFRIMGRKAYRNISAMENLDVGFDSFIKKLNYCMLSINFRREPIYLTEKQLNSPERSKYKLAVETLPSLKVLREHFIGRVIHSNNEQWKKDVLDLLRFNVSTGDDSLKWNKEKPLT